VPVQLLDVLLALVDEEQLRRDLQRLPIGVDGGGGRFVLVVLDRQVPKGELVVRPRGGEDGRVGRVPLDRGDGRGVP